MTETDILQADARGATYEWIGAGAIAVAAGVAVGLAADPLAVSLVVPVGVAGAALLGRTTTAVVVLLACLAAISGLATRIGALSGLLHIGVLLLAVIRVLQEAPSARRRWLGAPWLGWGYALFVLAMLASVAVSVDSLQSLRSFVRFCAPLALYYVVYSVAREHSAARQRIQWALGLSVLVPLLVGGAQMVGGGETVQAADLEADSPGGGGYEWTRFHSTFEHPNAFAAFLAVTLPFLIAVWRLDPVRWRRRVWLTLMGAGTLELLLGQVRSAWIAAVVGVLVFLAVNRRLSVTKRVLWVVAVVVGLALLTQTSIVRSRVADLFASPVQTLLTQDVFEGGARSSLHTRIWLWINAAGLIRDRPVLGWGIGTWYSQLATATLQGFSLHSDYVHAAVETGLVGLAAFLMLRVSLLRAALGGIGTGKDEDGNQLASAALGCVCAVCLLGITESVFFAYSAVEWYVWGIMGCAQAALRPVVPLSGSVG